MSEIRKNCLMCAEETQGRERRRRRTKLIQSEMIGKKKLWSKPVVSLHGEGLAADAFLCRGIRGLSRFAEKTGTRCKKLMTLPFVSFRYGNHSRM